MGGGDKGLLELGGRPMLAHVIERLSAQAGSLVLNANGDPSRFASFGLPVVADDVEGFAGPLAGVLAGLDFAAERHPEAVFVATAAADTPFFPEDLVAAFLGKARSERTIVLAVTDDGRHPVFGLWPVAVRHDLRAFLARGETRKVLAFVEAHDNDVAHFDAVKAYGAVFDPFFNVNTPEDLQRAETIAANLSGMACQPEPRPRAAKPARPIVFGVSGWKNAGKTTLVTRLIAEFVARGLSVASVKHAHHAADVDRPGSDSFRHRQAGAVQTALVSVKRMAIMREFATPADEPSLADVLTRLDPADVVIVEGYKASPIAKIEARRRGAGRHDPLHPGDATVVAVAADHAVEDATVPVFGLDDIAAMADFVLDRLADQTA